MQPFSDGQIGLPQAQQLHLHHAIHSLIGKAHTFLRALFISGRTIGHGGCHLDAIFLRRHSSRLAQASAKPNIGIPTSPTTAKSDCSISYSLADARRMAADGQSRYPDHRVGRIPDGMAAGRGNPILAAMHQFAREIADGGALFRALIATSVDGIMVIDERGTVLVYSDACARLFGYEAVEVLGNNVRMLMPQPYHREHDDYLARYRATGEKHIIGIGRDVTGRRKDGGTFPMYLSVGEGILDGKRIFVGIVHDISGEKERDRRIQELQEELLHATRLTAMGQLSSAIAHELNQPLGAVMAYMGAMQRLLAMPAPPLDALKDAASHAARDADRAGQIIRRLRAFVEKRETVRAPEALAPLVAEAAALASPGLKSIAIVTDVPCDLPELKLDRVQIQQVLVNLLRNAAEAAAATPEPKITVTARREDNDVCLSVRDNGPGITPAIAARLFEPFVTSKTDGMGMGLNICRTIMEAHGGHIGAESPADGGAIFHIRLPVTS